MKSRILLPYEGPGIPVHLVTAAQASFEFLVKLAQIFHLSWNTKQDTLLAKII